MAPRLAPVLMVQGATSGAGKSLLVTALARWFARRGVRVAPFKAQNMSNHARVAAGGELGSAQYLQALAAGVTPEVRMNPVLLKPEADTRSQLVLLGRADRELSALPWTERKPRLWPVVRESLRALREEYDLIVAEGAGSPAEVNLRAGDIVNMAVAREAGAAVLLVADIDRGGAFAHLWGTWSLLADGERRLVRGFVLNKFRGDADLLAPAPELLERWTGVPTVGVLPCLQHRLPDEDAPKLGAGAGAREGPRVAIVAYPYASNLDEFWPLADLARVDLTRDPDRLEGADLVILPGSKHVAASAAWLSESGMDRALKEYAAAGKPVLGVCGGLQILGRRLRDPAGVEGEARGLGLLEVETTLDPNKTVRRTSARFAALPGFWKPLSGLRVDGYEIHHGRSRAGGAALAVMPNGLAYSQGNVLGVYLHGLFEQPELQRALFGRAATGLEAEFDRLTDALDEHLDMNYVAALAAPSQPTVAGGPVEPPSPPPAARLIFYTGGARAGKSAAALARARALGKGDVSFIATARADDEEMARRIAAHRAERPAVWETIEEPRDAAAALARAAHDVIVLDCLTLLVSNLLLEGGEEAVRDGVKRLLEAWRKSGKTLIVVSNEVGMGIVPTTALARRYRDLLGWANRALAAAADEAWLVVAGRQIPFP